MDTRKKYMKKYNISLISGCAVVWPIGLLPGGGTIVSTIIFLSAYLCGYYTLPVVGQIVFAFLISSGSYWIIRAALPFFSSTDPREIVLDEVAGALYALIAVPADWRFYILSFLLFRFFDITKAAGIARIENIPGAAGVLLDDCAAGICAALLTALCTVLI